MDFLGEGVMSSGISDILRHSQVELPSCYMFCSAIYKPRIGGGGIMQRESIKSECFLPFRVNTHHDIAKIKITIIL